MDTNINTQTKTLTTSDPGTPTPPTTPTAKKRLRIVSKGSLADLFRDWTELMAAVADHPTDLATLEPQRAALQAFLTQSQTLSAQQNAQTAASQVTTQQLQAAVRDGRKAASRIRAGIKSQFGYGDAKLVQFGTKPLGRRASKKTSTTPTPVG